MLRGKERERGVDNESKRYLDSLRQKYSILYAYILYIPYTPLPSETTLVVKNLTSVNIYFSVAPCTPMLLC